MAAWKKALIALVIMGGMVGLVRLSIWINYISATPPPKVITIERVARIFMHEPGDYSFLVQESVRAGKPSRYRMVHRKFYEEPRFIADVPEDKMMWVRYQERDNRSRYSGHFYRILEFHIRSVKDIGGAGWDHGKFGSGRTNVVE